MTAEIRIPQLDTPEWDASMATGGLFDQWHAACRERHGGGIADAADTDLMRLGFEKMAFLDGETAEKLRNRIDLIADIPGRLIESGNGQDKVNESSDKHLFSLLGKVFHPEAERRITHYFGCDFFVHWYLLSRTHPSPAPNVSFLWHRDWGPETFLNMMIYLNGTGEHGGGTQFLDMQTTKKLAAAGYDYPPVSERLSDLSELAEKAGAEYNPAGLSLAPGEGFIFQPTKVLHRGILPTQGTRYVLFLNLMPSCCPWREGFRRWTMNYMESVASNWSPNHFAVLAGDDGPTVISA